MNIHEDFEREEVTSPVKAVLFANAFRLIEPKDRECQFTEKCITAALRSSTALVATTDLYAASQYLADQAAIDCRDDGYAELCRTAILKGVGPVAFPDRPSRAVETETNKSV